MEFVHPIKDIEAINEIKQHLLRHSKRDYLFFVLGINTGLRLSDLLTLKVSDVWDGQHVTSYLYPNDSDTPFFLNQNAKNAILEYVHTKNYQPEHYLFQSNKGIAPITRQQAYRIIKKAAEVIGVQENIGAHTLRKTFGYHAYKKGVAISLLQKMFHHSSTNETLHYLDIHDNNDSIIQIDVNL
ncbi:tyrosine-type recombinase/integrase [Gracilibacillus caseinilyticus]|uniref:Tyrosine-type recombinase/integrase n=1 Tax=Gracilibacillus caseinilyticus TaxID=2932256 RepID=A0ABY4F1R6_9BACI|nr:tyrosine-type recombinase/integrase [Gracilibacillus caseinilyticus]UOQ50150.1 tyrosine-type recombinase/integrase [Gracilibacillus caseinilyticus]